LTPEQKGDYVSVTISYISDLLLQAQKSGFNVPDHVLRMADKSARYAEHISKAATFDGLTGLYDVDVIRQIGEDTVENNRRANGKGVSVIFIDLDGFKEVNDTYEHKAGNAALRSFGRILRKLRETDISAGRYGGDEFLVVLPDTDYQGAIEAEKRIRDAFEYRKARYLHMLGKRFPQTDLDKVRGLSYSAGIASAETSCASFDELKQRADAAMYKAKKSGKKGVAVSDS